MKQLIVETDNFGGDFPNETFLQTPPLDEQRVAQVCAILNEAAGPNYPRFWKAVPIDYTLVPGFEP